nr:MAG TPA: hypothetical protein [Crassvirales sp.]
MFHQENTSQYQLNVYLSFLYLLAIHCTIPNILHYRIHVLQLNLIYLKTSVQFYHF